MSVLLTLAVLCTWIVIAIGLAATGTLFLDRLGGMEPGWRHAYYSIWTGFALTIAGLLLWNFFLPVNAVATVTFAVSAALALIVERRWFSALMKLPFSWRFAAAAFAFAAWTANHALAAAFSYDDYVYEFQAIRWYHDFRVIPGLANVDGPIGFNNSHHLFAALLSVGLWKGQVNHIFNGLFIVLASVYCLYAVWEIAKGTSGSAQKYLFPALLICPCAGLVEFGVNGSLLATLKADAFVAAATVVLCCLFLEWTSATPGTRESEILAATTLMIGAVIPSVKISALAHCGLLVVFVIGRLLTVKRGLKSGRAVIGALAVATVLAICVPIRGTILSGYALYPMTALRLNVDWRVPIAFVESERAVTTSFGRLQTTSDPLLLSGWQWTGNWARFVVTTEPVNIVLPLVLMLICVPMLFVPKQGNPPDTPNGRQPWWAYAAVAGAILASLAVWFIESPQTRFIYGQPWILFAAILCWGVERRYGKWSWKPFAIGLAMALPLAALLLLHFTLPSSRIRVLVLLAFAGMWIVLFAMPRANKPRLLALLCLLPVLYQYGERAAGNLATRHFADLSSMVWANTTQLWNPAIQNISADRTRSGLTVYESLYNVFDSPIPNTQYFNPFLELRTSRIEDGFRISNDINSAAVLQGGFPAGNLFESFRKQGTADLEAHNDGAAIEELVPALKISSRVGDRKAEGTICLSLAEIFARRNKFDQARRMNAEAVHAFNAIGDQEMAAKAEQALQRVPQGK